MKKPSTTTGAHCLGCDWTEGPGPVADVDRAAEKHTAKGHPTATVTVALLAAVAFMVIVAGIALLAVDNAWTATP